MRILGSTINTHHTEKGDDTRRASWEKFRCARATGKPLTDENGNVTSHLVGLEFRTTRLISDYDIDLVFVFDGKLPNLKREEIKTRREARRIARAQLIESRNL